MIQSLLVIALLSLCGVAAAQTPPAPTPPAPTPPAPTQADAARREQAKSHFIRGVEFTREGKWDAALAEFLVSRELHPTRVAQSNAAECLRNLQRYAEAYTTYGELLRTFSAILTAEERVAIDAALGELRGYIGGILVSSNPAGATVAVDGQPRGITPLSGPLLVDAGTHSVLVYKPGYQAFSVQVAVAGRQQRLVAAALVPLRRSGILVVAEASGLPLTVLVDGAAVGKAPWEGVLAVGAHTVALQGEGGIGTAPSSAVVREGETLRLVLAASMLDSELRIEPSPSNAQVFVDGVLLGSGVWQGRVKSGPHRVEVAAEGHNPFREVITVERARQKVVRPALERDLSNPRWRGGFSPHLYIELMAGFAWSPSLGGDADARCGSPVSSPLGPVPGCDAASASGVLSGLRGGLEVARGLGVELFAGYLGLGAEQHRSVGATGEESVSNLFSYNHTDTTKVMAIVAAASASYRLLDRTPITFRVWAGAARARVATTNQGLFTGTYSGTNGTGNIEADVRIPERTQDIWMPILGPEARFGVRLGKRVSIDAGVSALWAFPPETPRTADNLFGQTRQGRRTGRLPPVELADGSLAEPGTLTLATEQALGSAFFMVVPSLAVRVDF